MIYLDSAATTLQKPKSVLQAMQRAAARYASPGRGGYPAAMEAAEVLYRCREQAAELFHAPGPEQVVFTSSATMALNMAIRSLVKPGMTVVVSGYEHNAVTRCVSAIPEVTMLVAEGQLFQPEQLVCSYQRWVNRADVAICNAVSNVFGYCLPVADIAALCYRNRVPLIVDASQAAGCLPVDMAAWGAAYVAMPGHKSLYGPQGTGILLCAADANPTPLLYGGTGSQSRDQAMPDFLPDRLEAGTDKKTGRTVMHEVAGSEEELPCQLLLIAAGFLGPQTYVAETFGLERTPRSCVSTAPGGYATNVPKVFAAGDMRRGQSLVVWAIQEGRAAAHEVDTFLMGYSN